MSAVFGALLLAASVVLYRWAYIHHRRPVRSRWARNGAASMLVQFAMLSCLAAGLSLAIQFALTYRSQEVTFAEVGAVLAIAAVAALLLRILKRQRRRFQLEAPSAAASVEEPQAPANDPGRPRRAS